MAFWAYMLHCRGGKFYTGHTDDLDRRLAQHQSGIIKGFTSDRLPVELVWSQEFVTRDEAKAAEKRIKGWSRLKKLALVRGDREAVSAYAKSKAGPSTSSGQADVGVSQSAYTAMLAAARAAHPHEACGILLGRGTRILQARPTRNVHPTPATHFEIDPAALIAAHRTARVPGALQVLGYYHSHPLGLPEPSATDRAMAAHDGRIWAIIAGQEVRLWRDGDDGFAPLFFSLIEG